MSGIPGSRVAGVGPTPPGEQPHHAACRQRTPEEDAAVKHAYARRNNLAGVLRESVRLARHLRTCTDPTCYCDWSPDER